MSPPAAANRPFLISDLIDSAKSDVMPQKAVQENAELSELEALFRDNYKVIFRVAYRITGSESDAEDVLQTIFLRLTPNRRATFRRTRQVICIVRRSTPRSI